MQSSARIDEYYEVTSNCSYLVKSGRAVCYPIYSGTFERRDITKPSYRIPAKTFQHRDYMIRLVKDCSRSIDYLFTRDEIDTDKLAFAGFSWGGWMGNIILAVETRFKVAYLVIGGLRENRRSRPEVDPINFITRIRVPILMLNGRYDFNFPHDVSVEPMYRLLGTPEPDKKIVWYETDHFIPRTGLIKESLDWLDKYLGPVK
jgi:dienelactone hydrolase